MSILNAIILGLVQGIAEFLPISGSGHFSILNNLFNMTTADGGHLFYDVMLNLATLASVCIVYWQDIASMFHELIGFANLGPMAGEKKQHYGSARLFIMIVVGSLPLLLILPINDMLGLLSYKSAFIGVMLILTGCILYISDRMYSGKKTERSMSMLDAIIIGLCQAVSAIPGLSRSGITITAGISTGLNREFAVKFSFLLSLPALFGSNLLSFIEAVKIGIDWASMPAYLIGTAVAMVAGIASISLVKRITAGAKLSSFSYYCWVVGVLAIILTVIF